MKRYLIVVAFLSTYSLQGQQILFPQSMTPGVFQPGTSLQAIINNISANASATDTAEGGFQDRLNEFQAFWQRRATANDSTADSATKNNMFSQYFQALRYSIADRSATDCSSTGFQGNWQCIGPDTLCNPLGPGAILPYQDLGKVDAVWADPNDSNFILAGTVGGLFKTIDGGAHWVCITDNAPIVTGVIGISSIAVNPLNRDTIYLGTTGYDYGAGILKTYDGGATWQQEFISTGTPTYGDSIQFIQRVYFTPDGARLYAFYFDSVFTRINFGTGNPWINITPINMPATDSADFTWYELHFLPGNQDHIFICNRNGTGQHLPYCGIWEADVPVPTTSDWTKITTSLTGTLLDPYRAPHSQTVIDDSLVTMSFAIPDSDTLFAIGLSLQDQRLAGLWKYNLTGSPHTWTLVNAMPDTNYFQGNSSWTHFILAVNDAPTDSNGNKRVMYYGNDILTESVDGGQSFVQMNYYQDDQSHCDVRAICIQSATNSPYGNRDLVFFANDGGVSKKPSGWSVENYWQATTTSIDGRGLTCGEFWSVAVNNENDLVVGGMQHDGVVSFQNSFTPPWCPEGGADASTCVFDYYKPTEAYAISAASGTNRVFSVPNFGRTIGWWENEIANKLEVTLAPPIIIDTFNTQYEGEKHLWRKYNSQPNFLEISTHMGLPNDTSSYITEMIISPYQRQIIAFPHDTLPYGYFVYSRSPNKLYFNIPGFSGTSGRVDSVIVPNACCYPVSGIAMDPVKPQKVWVSESGAWGWPNIDKIYYSTGAGSTTFFDVSNGLNFHTGVSNIIYQEGSNDVLFCSTEVGIYRCDFSTFDSTVGPPYNIQWTCFNAGNTGSSDFPNAYVTDLKINYCQNKLYAATFGRSIWVSDLNPPNTIAYPDTVRTSVMWSGKQNITGSIDIQPGVTLTLSDDTIHMPRGGAIFVEPGAKLKLVNSLITNGCDQCFWQGVVVNGTTAAQTPANQGWLSMVNSSLQSATVAIATNGGGIVQATNCTLANNINSLTMNTYNGSNISYFIGSNFLIDDNFKGVAIEDYMLQFASLSQVRNVLFSHCNFRNTSTNATQAFTGEGVHGFNAGANMTSCTFSGLTNGVFVSGPGLSSDPVFTTQLCRFDSVSVGVNVSASSNVQSLSNTFNIGRGLPAGLISDGLSGICPQNIGIFTQNTPQFVIEGNTFNGINNSSSGWQNIGAAAVNTGGEPNNIYHNTFRQLNAAALCAGHNRDASIIPGPPPEGLLVECNEFDSNYCDIMVEPLAASSMYPQGIGAFQGSPSYLGACSVAGNTFNGSTYNIVTDPSCGIYYYFDTANTSTQRPNNIVGPTVVEGVTCSSTCASTYAQVRANGIPTAISPSSLVTAESAWSDSVATLFATIHQFNSQIDYGNTDSLISIVVGSISADSLFTILVNCSPWVSVKAFENAASTGKISNGEMVALINNNPDCLLDPTFLPNMDSILGFSKTELATLEDYSGRITARTSLLGYMTNMYNSIGGIHNRIMTGIKTPVDSAINMSDTTGAGICTDSNSVWFQLDSNVVDIYHDSIDIWLQHNGHIWTSYARTGLYLQQGMYSIADSIFSHRDSTLEDTAVTVAWDSLYTVVYGAYASSRDVATLTNDELSSLANEDPQMTYITPHLGVYNIMTYTWGPWYGTEPVGPFCAMIAPAADERKSSGNNHSGSIPPATDNSVIAYPNPSGGFVTFAYNMDGGIHLTVVNIMGEIVFVTKSIEATGIIQWNASSLQSGVYIYSANSSSGICHRGKIVLVR